MQSHPAASVAAAPESLPVALGCDCDPDRRSFGGPDYRSDDLSWQGNAVGIERFRRAREAFYRRTGHWPRMTWFVRADHQVARIHGDAGHCLRAQVELWRALEAEGDEIAWHPHLWARSDERGWYQSIGDDEFTRACLATGFPGFGEAWGRAPRAVHMGWCYHDNASMAFLADKGVAVDCSAVPGHNTLGAAPVDQSDWSTTPTHPYRPACADYRRPAAAGEADLPILELPASVGDHLALRLLKSAAYCVRQGKLFVRPGRFAHQVPMIAMRPAIARRLGRDALRRHSGTSGRYFFSYCHSDEFLPADNSSAGAARLYRLDHVFANLEHLARLSDRLGLLPQFVTVSELANLRPAAA